MFPDLRLSDASRSPLPPFARPAEIVAEIARGRPVILADRTDRENEGDLIIAADCVTPAVIALMAREARGLICLALHADIADSLGLEPLAKCGHGFRDTPFTRSIEASSGITTGISAADRATTIAAALSGRGPAAICSPGHVFPLVARRGGLAVRDGHTEASVTLAELAGRQPAAVICEIMNDDGTMARRDDLHRFALRHGLLMGTVEDLKAWVLVTPELPAALPLAALHHHEAARATGG